MQEVPVQDDQDFQRALEENSEQDYDETVEENGYLREQFKKHMRNPSNFLRRTEKVYVRSIKLDESAPHVWLEYETDIDGCVVELSDVSRVQIPVRHLRLCPHGKASLKDLKPVLKKHVDLTKYSRNALFNLANSVGIQLFYEHGWEGWLGIIPEHGIQNTRLESETVRHVSFETFEKLRLDFQKELMKCAMSGVAVQTIRKNNLNDLRNIFVLPDDVPQVLKALQTSVDRIKIKEFKPIVFCFRFGEKMKSGLSLKDFLPQALKKVTVHAALNISSRIEGIDLLWSMDGIQQVVENRGTLSTCLSLTDCGCYQSNLDGKTIAIKPELRKVSKDPAKLQFIQLYADLPHQRPKTRFHPVSGIIAGGMCFHHRTSEAFKRDSKEYISMMEHNFCLLRDSTCRLEIVTELIETPEHIKGTDIIDIAAVNELLRVKNMLVPIPSDMLQCIKSIGLWLVHELKDMFMSFQNTGNISATWRSFQFELACEKILWGKPLCDKTSRFSVNLGPGALSQSRSLTDNLGFLALESHTSCMQFEDSIPPPWIWTLSTGIGKSIERACGLHDHIDASYPVVGRLLLLALLKDLHELGKAGAYIRFEGFLAALKAEDFKMQVVGAITVNSLVQILVSKRRTPVQMVFGRLCQLLLKHKLPLSDIIQVGVVDLELKHFPAVETYDAHDNAVLKWTIKRSFWKIVHDGSNPSICDPESSTVCGQLVRAELERRGLIFAGKLKAVPENWPWIKPCLSKLVQEKLSLEQMVTTITFISALAFIMQDWYVDFGSFAKLYSDLPVPQFRLKTLEIQSRLELPKFKFQGIKLYRLHHRIPHKINVTKKTEETRSTVDNRYDEVELIEVETPLNCISEDDDTIDIPQRIERRTSSCNVEAVGAVRRPWSAVEMEIVTELISKRRSCGIKELYAFFRSNCMEKSVPLRTFEAFRKKWERLKDKII